MTDPVVTVIAGPGDAAQEQARLVALDFTFLDATPQLTIDQTTFKLEAVP